MNKYGDEHQERIVLNRERFMPNWKKGEVKTEMRRTTYLPIYDKGNIVCLSPLFFFSKNIEVFRNSRLDVLMSTRMVMWSCYRRSDKGISKYGTEYI